MFRTTSSLIILVPLAWACSSSDEAARDSARAPDPRPTQVVVEFDPLMTYRGDTVRALTVDSIAAQRTPNGEVVGLARFAGALILTGQTFRHPDGDDYPFPCFEADTTSARKLPRWSGDERRPWLCFENRDEARMKLGEASSGIPATIRVDRFTIHRNLSDAVNSARLIEVVSRGDSTAASTTTSRCYSTSASVLGRAPGTAAPAPPNVRGWIRFDGWSTTGADSGSSRLADSDGRSLTARWRRVGADSVAIVGFNDFVRVEMRVQVSAERLSGNAIATSDAAVTRDSAGRQGSFRRPWAIDAVNRPCDPGADPRSG
jgi:hypothetical protein